MNFISIEYALFLTAIFMIYWEVPGGDRWIVIMISSVIFYMSWNPWYILLLIFIVGTSYLFARLIDLNKSDRKRKLLLSISILICLFSLFLFKYLNFGIDIINSIIEVIEGKKKFEPVSVILPVGISFYTFHAVGYVIDVYRRDINPEKNIGIFFSYIMFFPQLVAGPIERARNLLHQIKKEHTFDYNMAVSGMWLILWGVFKKAVVADNLAVYVDRIYSNLNNYEGFSLVITALFFIIQIYCDFSGYTDIARGSARLLGIELMKNFKSPYRSHHYQ